ncbi:GIY-YIG nuclease family protein [Cytophaga aurantiaca]|uniref:GIY-YIG nuclease family protein n=1 Tax=Cytophaga aurantiaca TaxID=29530 RepID=UPI000372BABE|nr:GIY-YIG nuclease family protein [Cytophaga aurantiaca]
MDLNKFIKYRIEYIQKKKEELDYLLSFEMPEFKSVEFSSIDIDDEYAKNLLDKVNINKDSKIIYYIKINSKDKATQIIDLVTKKKKNKKVKLPLVNSKNNNSDILYVGKTNSNFPSRFKSHLCLTNPSTFALHLEHWKKDLPLHLTLWFAEITLDEDKYMEQLESILHDQLKPILGRSGH